MGGRHSKTYRQGSHQLLPDDTDQIEDNLAGVSGNCWLRVVCPLRVSYILLSVNVRITLDISLPLMGMVAIVQKSRSESNSIGGRVVSHPTGDEARRRDVYSGASDSGGRSGNHGAQPVASE